MLGGVVNGKVGEEIDAGLPNITGEFAANQNQNYSPRSASGAFSQTKIADDSKGSYGHNMELFYFNLDASKSNKIYGASETVQMAAHFVVHWKRVE